MHWPVGFPPGNGLNPPDNTKPGYMALDTETSISETWIGLTKLPKSKVRAVGVSNMTIANIEGVIKASGVIPVGYVQIILSHFSSYPSVTQVANQVEAHPLLPQDDLVAYCKEKNIHITAYSSFGNNCELSACHFLSFLTISPCSHSHWLSSPHPERHCQSRGRKAWRYPCSGSGCMVHKAWILSHPQEC
jgi:diketogulonate reductase-like aldo/keto reductase